ncbi:hypothetical protein KI387_044316, partial [Taxus chinensis]
MFDSFNIVHHDRKFNDLVDKLVVLGSRFDNYVVSIYCEYDVEVLTSPSVPDNIKHWQVFDDDAQ